MQKEYYFVFVQLILLNSHHCHLLNHKVFQELILQFFQAPFDETNHVEMTATEIKDYIEQRTKQQIRSMKRLGIELRKIFGKSHKGMKNGTHQRLYTVSINPDRTPTPS